LVVLLDEIGLFCTAGETFARWSTWHRDLDSCTWSTLLHRVAQQDRAPVRAPAGSSHGGRRRPGQALLLNYEEELTGQFGIGSSVATACVSRWSSGASPIRGSERYAGCALELPAALTTFITEYDAGLDESTATDPR
jgi:hypothetical protein